MKKTYDVQGMECVACAAAIERTLKKAGGVESAAVNYANSKLYVEFDEKQIDDDKIRSAVKKAGYELLSETKPLSKEFKVTGMDCVACAQSIERVLGKKEGVNKAAVNYATEKLYLDYDPSIIKTGEVKAIVDKLGFALQDEAAEVRMKCRQPLPNTPHRLGDFYPAAPHPAMDPCWDSSCPIFSIRVPIP